MQPRASEAELLRDGEPVLSVCGGLPQGLLRERGQTTMAQGLDAGQVCLCLSVCASLCFSVCLCSCAYVALYNSPLTNSLMVMTRLLKILQGENN